MSANTVNHCSMGIFTFLMGLCLANNGVFSACLFTTIICVDIYAMN